MNCVVVAKYIYIYINIKMYWTEKSAQKQYMTTYLIEVVLVCVQWVSPSTLKLGSGTTEWLGTDAALWWTPGGKQVTGTTVH